jgi:fibronectin type 3 domain-containing protein
MHCQPYLTLLVLLGTAASLQALSPPLRPGNSGQNDPDESTWTGIVIPTTGVLPAAEVHPSLYFTADQIDELRARANGLRPDPHGYYASRWDRIRTNAISYNQASVSANDDAKGMAAKALAFAWLITGETAYRDKAIANLKAAYTSIQSGDQYVALQMTNYALAYDWVAAATAPADASAMRAAIKRGADWLYNYLSPGGPRNHNHRSKAGGALASWALAFAEDPDAQTYLNRALLNIHNVWKYMFTQDGIHRDGAGYYWIFTIINTTPFLHQYANVSGIDLFPALQPAFEWELKTSTPEGWLPNIEDGWYKITSLNLVAARYRATPTELSANGTLGELFQWRFFNSSWDPVRYDYNWTGAANQYYGWPDEFILYDSSIEEVQPDALAGTLDFSAGPRGGATVLRNHWGHDDPSARYLYFEGTPMSFNHDHADALQFIIHAENSILARDAGYGPSRFEGREAYIVPEQHNVLTASGAALGDPEPTRYFLNLPAFALVEKQARYWNDANALHNRAIAFPGKDYFIIIDRASAATAKSWDNYFHNRGSLSGSGPARTWTTAAGQWGGAARLHGYFLPASMSISTGMSAFNPYGTGTTPPDLEETPYLRMPQTGTSAHYLQILVPRALAAATPSFADLSAGAVLGATIALDDYTDHAFSRSEPGAINSAGVTATASFVWLRREGETVRHWSAREATQLASHDFVLFSANRELTLAADLADPARMQVVIDADGAYTITLGYAGNLAYHQAYFNGAQVVGAVDGTAITFDLPGSGTLDIGFAALALPAIPAGLHAAPGDASVTLGWDAALYATTYAVYRALSGQPLALLTEGIIGTTFTDSTAVNGSLYSYAVAAVNVLGRSGPSPVVNATPQAMPPLPPTSLAGVATSPETIVLTWQAGSANTAGYTLQRATGTGDFADIAELDDSTTVFTDSGLAAQTAYQYRIRAHNDQGVSAWSEPVAVFTAPPSGTPGVPLQFQAVARGARTVHLSWQPADDLAAAFLLACAVGDDDFTVIARIDAAHDAWIDGLAEPSSTLHYQLRAVNAAGVSFPSEPATVTTADATGTEPLLLWLEAESAASQDNFAPWSVVDDLTAAAGAYITTSAKNTAAAPADGRIRYPFSMPVDGHVSLWVRLITTNAASDSLFINWDDAGWTSWVSGFTHGPDWYWLRWNDRAAAAGPRAWEITYRENNIRIDKWFLSSDTAASPRGRGAPAANGTTFPGSPGARATPLGWLDDSAYPWIEHAAHGALWHATGDLDGVWWHGGGAGWWHTAADLYPLLHSPEHGWLWAVPVDNDGRWFWDFAAGAWIRL